MDTRAIETMTLRGPAVDKQREHAEKVAHQFEDVFVRTLVSSLRQTSTIGEGGMFGDGPGADTYGDWFDQNLAEQVGRSGDVGIARQLMKDFERAGAIEKLDAAKQKVQEAAEAADQKAMNAAMARGKRGFDVVL